MLASEDALMPYPGRTRRANRPTPARCGTETEGGRELLELVDRFTVRLERVSCRALTDEPGSGQPREVRRRSKGVLVWRSPRAAEIMFVDRVDVKAVMRVDVRQRLTVEFTRNISSATLRRGLGGLSGLVLPVVSELVALFSRRLGLSPVIIAGDPSITIAASTDTATQPSGLCAPAQGGS